MEPPVFSQSLPLMEIFGLVVDLDGADGPAPSGLKQVSVLSEFVPQMVPTPCFVLELPDKIEKSVEPGKKMGIFGPEGDASSLNDIYLLGVRGRPAGLCRLVKRDSPSGTTNRGNRPRKSFMTPTPLHIPESRVSPIPESSHEMIYIREFSGDESVKVIPLREVVWMHPLIHVREKPAE